MTDHYLFAQEPAKSTQARHHLRAPRSGYQRLDSFHKRIARIDIDAGIFVSQWFGRHAFPAFVLLVISGRSDATSELVGNNKSGNFCEGDIIELRQVSGNTHFTVRRLGLITCKVNYWSEDARAVPWHGIAGSLAPYWQYC